MDIGTARIIPRSAKVERVFIGEGYFDLCLRLGELEDLQNILGIGLQTLSNRLSPYGDWRIADVKETLRLALIGAGMANEPAWNLVTRNVREGTLTAARYVAYCVVLAALMGSEDDPPGEPIAGETMTPPASSPSDDFTSSPEPPATPQPS